MALQTGWALLTTPLGPKTSRLLFVLNAGAETETLAEGNSRAEEFLLGSERISEFVRDGWGETDKAKVNVEKETSAIALNKTSIHIVRIVRERLVWRPYVGRARFTSKRSNRM